MPARLSHVIGIDDAPFRRESRGEVLVVGAVYAGRTLQGVLSTRVRRDGANATRRLAEMIAASRFRPQLHAVLLQGIALAGFNVVDIHALARSTGRPVLVVMRRRPDMAAVRRALLEQVPGGARKWQLVERAGPVEACGEVFVQRAGLTPAQAVALVRRLGWTGKVPEPLRAAHLIAGGIATGHSRGRV